MQLLEDADAFDDIQSYFSYEILRVIRNGLLNSKLTESQIHELTSSIGFHLSCLLDASAPFTVENSVITPILTFSRDGQSLIHQGAPSNLHDYVHGNADELFNE